MSSPSKSPLEWIQLELIPLPDQIHHVEECLVWWNPQTGEILGDAAETIIDIINAQLLKGSVTNTSGTIELSDPFKKPTELASVLGQFFWVVPMPVAHAYERAGSDSQQASESDTVALQ